MNLDAIPLFSMLKSRLGYVGERQRLIAQNVANADTPGYAPLDLKPFKVPASVSGRLRPAPVQPERTSPWHLIPTGAAQSGQDVWKAQETTDSEVTLDGNKVVLEDQMAKMTEARMDYEAAIGFYQKSMDMLRLAARAPGK
jgi:flagellar basal-body rod protein FlgB